MPTDSVSIGILLLLTGLVFSLLVLGAGRLLRRLRSRRIAARALAGDSLSSHDHAVFVVQPGGRLDYINPAGREWFGLREGEQANLESLARRIRPNDEFMRLCLKEGKARFSVNSRPVEAVSYTIPGAGAGMLVSLYRMEIASVLGGGGPQVSGTALKVLTDFSQALALSTGLPATIQTSLENIERLVPADMLEINLWDAQTRTLIPYRLGASAGAERQLEKSAGRPVAGYAAQLVADRKAVFIPNTAAASQPTGAAMVEQSAIRSYLGLPLIAGSELVGTLELGALNTEAYKPEDLEMLELISGQVASAIRTASMEDLDRRRAGEMSGLASLAQVPGSPRDLQEIISRLIEQISPLFDVEVIGFLLHNEGTRALEAQVPFTGMPAQVVNLYHVPLAEGSPAEERFLKQEVIFTRNAMEDDLWREMGFQDYARAASWRDSVLVPLVSSGRPLGFLQLSNHRNLELVFSPGEIQLLNIVANQVAPILDNFSLLRQVRQKAQRAEALRRIASLVSSSATLEEILRYSLQELARLLQADLAAIYQFDETRGLLRLHAESLFGLEAEANPPIARLILDEAQFNATATGSGKPLLTAALSEDAQILSVYRPLVEAVGIQSAMVVPLSASGQELGELVIGSRAGGAFSPSDVQIVVTAAGQLASVIEWTDLRSQTDQSLRERVDKLTALTRFSRELSSTQDWRYLLQTVYEESLRLTSAECGTVMLLSPAEGSEGELRISFQVGEQNEGGLTALQASVCRAQDPLLTPDFSSGSERPAHEAVRSSLSVPIVYHDQTLGLIDLHSSTPEHFDPGALELVQTLAVQAGIAFGNARRFQDQTAHTEQVSRRAKILSQLFEATSGLVEDQPLEQSLDVIARGLQEASPFQVVLISLLDPEGMLQRRVAAGIPQDTLGRLKTHQQPWASVASLMRPEFRLGTGYFIPNNQRPAVPGDAQAAPGLAAASRPAWQAGDALYFPIEDPSGQPIGLVSLDAPRDGLRPEASLSDDIQFYISQAAMLIGNKSRLISYQAQVERLSTSLDRQQQLVSMSQSHLPTLLHKDLEQMISIRTLEQRARRIRAGLEITETINRQVDSPSALQALGRELLTKLEMSVSVVAENAPDGPRLLHVLGSVPRGASPEALFGQRNPLRFSLQTGEPLLVMNLEQDDVWRDSPLLTSLHAKGFICLPILVDARPIAGVLAVSAEALPELTEEDRQTYLQISDQVSIILQNLTLLTETRRRLREVNLLLDFSRQLSGLDPDSVVQALLDSALRVITQAHAGVALIYEEEQGRLLPKAASGYADVDSLMKIVFNPGEALPGRVFVERKPRRVEEINFARDYNLPAEKLMHYRAATAGRLPNSSLVVPIQTGDRTIGVLTLDNFNTVGAFTADDQALLLSLTQQVALSLENVRLVHASQERASQLQALTSVSATMTASLLSSELVLGLLDRLKEVMAYDTGILWLREGELMRVAAASGFPDTEQRLGLTVNIADSSLLAEMSRSSQAIVVGDVRLDQRFPSLVEAERLSWMGVPLVSKGEVIGVIALEKTEANYFTLEVTQLIATFASQAAVALENARLYEESLRRAAELDERSQRLSLLNRLSSDLSGSLNEDQVLSLTAEELQRAFNAKTVSMIAFNRFGNPILRAVVPASEKFQPETLPQAPIFDRLRESLGVFTTEAVRNEPDLEPLKKLLKGTRSLLILPLVSAQNLRALAFVHMEKDHHFSATDIDLTRTISNQAAVALESARLYQSTVLRAEQLTIINRASYEIGVSLDPEQIYAAIHRAAAELMPLESFIISLVDEQRGDIEGVYLVDPSGRAANQRLPREVGISGQVITSGEPLLLMDVSEADRLGVRTFGENQPRSIVAVPIAIAGRVIGMLSAQSYQPNVYSEDEQQILSTLANQAAVAIQNGRLFEETRRLAQELEQRVIERTAELAREQRNTETLLRILTEASSTLDIDRALNRTLALLNDAIGAEQGSILMVNPEDNTIHYRAGYGYLTPVMTEGSRPTPLKIGEGLAGWVIKSREPVRLDDVRQDPRWMSIQSSTTSHRSAIAAPLMVGEEAIGVIMVFHRQEAFFTPEQTNLVRAIGNQVAVAINNAQLYNLIRDQAERLGSMLRNQQIEASRQQAILEAVADGVLVTDPSNGVTFLNRSAERILGLDAKQVGGKPLEDFVGTLGGAAQTWMETVQTWSREPGSHQATDSYAEQLTLESGRVVLVHLAPVVWRKEFLGTVSIFRDITREVEIDRLKSEFVATVSHELRTPMTSIKGYVDILLMGAAGALNENQTHFLDIVRSNTDRLNVLVSDLLDISRMEAGKVSLTLQPINLRELAEEIVANISRQSQTENKPMEFSMDIPADLPPVSGDLERVRQILDNIVDNAYHYTPENGKVTIRMQARDGRIQVDVQDNGIGISPLDADRVFDRFFRGEDPLVLATPGTGLGLAIVKQLVNMHQGEIWMTSQGKPGEGSVFSFTLPIHQAEEH